MNVLFYDKTSFCLLFFCNCSTLLSEWNQRWACRKNIYTEVVLYGCRCFMKWEQNSWSSWQEPTIKKMTRIFRLLSTAVGSASKLRLLFKSSLNYSGMKFVLWQETLSVIVHLYFSSLIPFRWGKNNSTSNSVEPDNVAWEFSVVDVSCFLLLKKRWAQEKSNRYLRLESERRIQWEKEENKRKSWGKICTQAHMLCGMRNIVPCGSQSAIAVL